MSLRISEIALLYILFTLLMGFKIEDSQNMKVLKDQTTISNGSPSEKIEHNQHQNQRSLPNDDKQSLSLLLKSAPIISQKETQETQLDKAENLITLQIQTRRLQENEEPELNIIDTENQFNQNDGLGTENQDSFNGSIGTENYDGFNDSIDFEDQEGFNDTIDMENEGGFNDSIDGENQENFNESLIQSQESENDILDSDNKGNQNENLNQNQHEDPQSNTQSNDSVLVKPNPNNSQDEDQFEFQARKWQDHGHFNREGQVEYGSYMVRCSLGCRVCSNTTNLTQCQICMDGYSIDSTTNTCKKCDDVCLACSSDDQSNCTSCYPGWTLKLDTISQVNSCVKCSDQSCGNCSTQTSCLFCKKSFYLDIAGKCANCVNDCRVCSDKSTCTECFNGYFVNVLTSGSSECKICSDGCALCTKLTDCQKCYPGFFYDNSTSSCQKCSSNCWNCTSQTNCSRCVIGSYLVDTNCVQSIQNCAVMNSNSTCSKCFWGYRLDSARTSCIASNDTQSKSELMKQFACNTHEFRKGQKCQNCNSTITNCQQCNSTICLRCIKGYLLSVGGTVCNPCNKTLTGCQGCENSIFCTQCLKGYYMEQDLNGTQVISYGNCIKCNDNCLTCNEKDIYCTSCPTGFDLTTSRVCVPQNQFNFTLLLNLDLAKFMEKIGSFKTSLLKLIDDNSVSSTQKENFLQITKISTGSIKVEGTMSATSSAAIQSTKQSFESAISSGSTFSGIEVLSSGITPIKYQSTNTETQSNADTSSSSSSNTGMIIGIAVGVACAVIIGVAVAVYCLCFKKKQSTSEERNLDDKRTTSTVDDFIAIQTIQSDKGLNVQNPYTQKANKNRLEL